MVWALSDNLEALRGTQQGNTWIHQVVSFLPRDAWSLWDLRRRKKPQQITNPRKDKRAEKKLSRNDEGLMMEEESYRKKTRGLCSQKISFKGP